MRNMVVLVLLVLLVLSPGCEAPPETSEPTGESPTFPSDRPNAATSEVVAVDWLGRGQLFAGRVTGRRGELTGIIYADGDREWVEESRIRPWPNLTGQQVQIWSRASARNVVVLGRRHGLYHVRFEDGADTWASRDMLYALSTPPATPPTNAPSAFPPRGPEREMSASVGDHVLAYWISGGELQRTQPWLASVTASNAGGVSLTYSDGSEATVPATAILRVFSPGRATVAVGRRVWTTGSSPVGTIIDERSGFVKLRSGSTESWVEVESLLGDATPIEAARLESGVFVTALWSGSTLYHATVVSVEGGQVTLAWHDGSTPSAVPIEDVLEIWRPS